MANPSRQSRPTRPMTLQEKYFMGREILNAVPIERVARSVHCSRGDARDLQIAIIQLLRTSVIFKLPRGVTFNETIDVRMLTAPRIQPYRRSRRWTTPSQLQQSERMQFSTAPRWQKTKSTRIPPHRYRSY